MEHIEHDGEMRKNLHIIFFIFTATMIFSFLVFNTLAYARHFNPSYDAGGIDPSKWMRIFGSFTIEGQPAQIGDEIGVYYGNLLCGDYIVEFNPTSTHYTYIYGRDIIQLPGGPLLNNALTIKIWDSSENLELDITTGLNVEILDSEINPLVYKGAGDFGPVNISYSSVSVTITNINPIQGNNNAPVQLTISGQHFAVGATVTLIPIPYQSPGNTQLSSSFINENSIVATVPAQLSTGNYRVEVKNPDQNKATYDYYEVLYSPPLGPVIDVLNPTEATNEEEQILEIIGSNFLCGSGFVVKLGNTPLSIYNNMCYSGFIKVIIPAQFPSGVYNLTVINPGGAQDSEPFEVTSEQNIDFQLSGGLNIIGFPMDINNSFNSSYNLMDHLLDTELHSILNYDSSAQNWEISYWDNGTKSGIDFPIQYGKSYLLYILGQEVSLSLPGNMVEDFIDLHSGINLISFVPSISSTAFRLLLDLGMENTTCVQKYDTDKGSWLSAIWLNGLPAGSNFSLTFGEGCVIHMLKSKDNWLPSTL